MKHTIFTLCTTASLYLFTPHLQAQEKESAKKADKPVEKKITQPSPLEPVIKEIMLEILKEWVKEDSEFAPPATKHEKIADQVVNDFKLQAPKWTKKDSKLLEENKSLVKDYNKTHTTRHFLLKLEVESR